MSQLNGLLCDAVEPPIMDTLRSIHSILSEIGTTSLQWTIDLSLLCSLLVGSTVLY